MHPANGQYQQMKIFGNCSFIMKESAEAIAALKEQSKGRCHELIKIETQPSTIQV